MGPQGPLPMLDQELPDSATSDWTSSETFRDNKDLWHPKVSFPRFVAAIGRHKRTPAARS